jgi:hypothetical protein
VEAPVSVPATSTKVSQNEPPIGVRPAPLSLERICFTRSLPWSDRPSARLPGVASLWVLGVLLAIMLVWILATLGGLRVPFNAIPAVFPLSILVLLPTAIVLGIRSRRRHDRACAGLNRLADRTCRVVCAGPPSVAIGGPPLDNVQFPPATYLASFATRRPRWLGLTWWATFGLCFGLGVVLDQASLKLGPGWYLYVFPFAAGGVSELAIALLFPTYIRLLPGRMDVLTFFTWRSAALTVRSHNLRLARLEIDLQSHLLRIRETDQTCLVVPKHIPRGHEFIRTLLLAALSTHTPVAVPMDRLIE